MNLKFDVNDLYVCVGKYGKFFFFLASYPSMLMSTDANKLMSITIIDSFSEHKYSYNDYYVTLVTNVSEEKQRVFLLKL